VAAVFFERRPHFVNPVRKEIIMSFAGIGIDLVAHSALSVVDDLESLGETLQNVGDGIQNLGQGLEGLFDSLSGGAGGAHSAVSGKLDDIKKSVDDLISQIARDGQKETRKKGGGEKGEGSGACDVEGGSGSSLRDLAEALGKAVSDRVASAKAQVEGLSADSDQGQILKATAEVGAAGFLATSAAGALQAALQGTNELARKG
jgi:hypothetical protein